MIKYSNKFLNQNGKLKSSKIGFEFEFYTKDISFYKTLEILNDELKPVKVWGFRKYHSDFTPDSGNFKIEPDLSGGSNMVELVTGPMDYYEAKYYLVKILNFINNYGYTNDKCSIHFNISFSGEKDLNDLNILKLILNTDEDEVYRYYPTRKDNVYAKSIKKIIPFREYSYFNIPIGVIKNNLRLPNDKYYGINFTHINNNRDSQRLEFRYIGGKDYEKKSGHLIYFMERFIINVYDSIDVGFNSEDINKLEEYLETNIKQFKNFSKYDNFLVDYPKIQIQIDQVSNYDVVSTYYDKIYQKIFNLVDGASELGECIINYVTETQTMEIVDSDIKGSSTLKYYDFINCRLEGIFENCQFIGSEIKNSQITKGKLEQCDLDDTKVLYCKVENSDLRNCYFMEGYLNSNMHGGVFRSGDLGPYAYLDSDVKIVNNDFNFFQTKYDEEELKGDKKGKITGYGKNIK